MIYFILALFICGLVCASVPPKTVAEVTKQPNKKQPNDILQNGTMVSAFALKNHNKTRLIRDNEGQLSHVPYTVSIGVTGHQCAGVIIGKSTTKRQWILTTASCVAG